MGLTKEHCCYIFIYMENNKPEKPVITDPKPKKPLITEPVLPKPGKKIIKG